MSSYSSSPSRVSSSIEIEDLKEIFQRYQKRQHERESNNNILLGTNVEYQGKVDDNDTVTSLASITCTSFDEEGWDEIMVGGSINEKIDDDDPTAASSTIALSSANYFWQQQQQQATTTMPSLSMFSSKPELITPHVIAHQSWICGIVDEGEDNDDDQRMSIRWKTSLAPHRILQVASNRNGSIVAATTDLGTVSILRGSDGKVLATRRVNVLSSSAESQNGMTTHQLQEENDDCNDDYNVATCSHLSFVASALSSSNDSDALLVFSSDHDGLALLISNIQGSKLNDNRPNVVAQASQAMNLHTVKIPTIAHQNIHCMVAVAMTKDDRNETGTTMSDNIIDQTTNEIRILFVHGNTIGQGKLGLANYDLGKRTCTLIDRNVGLKVTESSNNLTVSNDVKLIVRSIPKVSSRYGHYLMSFVAFDEDNVNTPLLCLIDPTNIPCSDAVVVLRSTPLTMSRNDRHCNMDGSPHSKIRVGALTFVDSLEPDTVAVSVVLLSDGSAAVKVLQSRIILNDSCHKEAPTMFSVGPTHKVYSIPIPSSIAGSLRSICLTSVATIKYGPYAFRAKIDVGYHKPQHLFVFKTANDAHDGSAIGNIRALSDQGNFKEARALVHRVGMEVLLQDRFANFHPAEIALQRLDRLLKDIRCHNPQSMSTSLICESLDIIERGVGHPEGQRVALEAIGIILDWPGKESPDCAPSIEQVAAVCSKVLEMLKRVANEFADEDVDPAVTRGYSSFVQALGEKIGVMTYLRSKLEKDKVDFNEEEKSGLDLPLVGDFASVKSTNNLFSCFIRHGLFHAAEELWRCPNMKAKLTSQEVIGSIVQIPSTYNPMQYCSLLKNVILHDLSISHELLPHCLAWSCRMADGFDDPSGTEDGLDRAIFLLQTINQATKQLNLRVHSSFSHYSPFADRSPTDESFQRLMFSGKDATVGTSAVNTSIVSSSNFNVSFDTGSVKNTRKINATTKLNDAENMRKPSPTLLELATMKRGAQKARQVGQIPSLREDAFEISEGSVEMKLDSAHHLKLARAMGLKKGLVTLRDFKYRGGAQFIAKELIRTFSATMIGEDEKINESLVEGLSRFCEATKADYDLALVSYAKELCGENTTNHQDVLRAASIARCCKASPSKIEIVLTALRASLFLHHSPPWLKQLSKDAIKWAAGDSSLRTELEEASRLLLIDEIVGRYCGEGAKQMFHVDNPLHAIRLLEHIVRDVSHDCVLLDVFHLCEAFHHLSEEDGCTLLIQNAILQKNSAKAQDLLSLMYGHNQNLALSVYSNAITLCVDIIEEASSMIGTVDGHFVIEGDDLFSSYKDDVVAATSCARALTKIALGHSSLFRVRKVHYDEHRLRHLSQNLARAQALQNDHNIYIPFTQLENPTAVAATTEKLVSRIAQMYKTGQPDTTNGVIAQTKRAITILADTKDVEETDMVFAASLLPACNLAMAVDDLRVLDFLSSIGVNNSSDNELADRCCLSVAITLGMKSLSPHGKSTSNAEDSMKSLVKATSLLQDYMSVRCSPKTISILVTITDIFDVISRTMTRADEGIGESVAAFRQALLERSVAGRTLSFDDTLRQTNNSNVGRASGTRYLTLHPNWYVGDGLLLPPDLVISNSLLYWKGILTAFQLAEDVRYIDSIRDVAFSRGAHGLAHQFMVHSALLAQCRDDDGVLETLDYEFFNEQLCIALVERHLGGTSNGITSGIVDAELAVSFLLSLPLKLAFKIYRSSLPSAINMRQFERVRVLANIGRAAGSSTGGNWSRHSKFVAQCDWLATKATWWKLLEESDVTFDPQLFPDNRDDCKTSSARCFDHCTSTESSYPASLLPLLIERRASLSEGVEDILACVAGFANSFGLSPSFPIQSFIEYLLLPSDVSTRTEGPTVKPSNGGRSLESLVRSLVFQVDSPIQRVDILRRCILRFEKLRPCVDYEKLSVIFVLYHTELSSFLSKEGDQANDLMKTLVQEMDLIDRRRDALGVLSSFYRDDKKMERPSFSDFFIPLPDTISKKVASSNTQIIQSHILGWVAQGSSEGGFDPLSPLDATLRSSWSPAVASALAPLCFALDVPRGYIRARSLIARFEESKKQGAALPSFEEDVLPLLNKLISASDAAQLAEWCSAQYSLRNPDKLKSLDFALLQAVKASSEAEKRRADEHVLLSALTRVKHLTAAKDLLADRLEINSILESSDRSQGECRTSFSCLVDKLAKKLDSFWENKSSFAPEHFVRNLLEEASLIAAEAALEERGSISVGLLRKFSLMVHKISCKIAAKYSHVQVGSLARKLTSMWLLHGDNNVKAVNYYFDYDDLSPVMSSKEEDNIKVATTEDETVELELNLYLPKAGEKKWNPKISSCDGVVAGGTKSTKNQHFATDEESSCVRPTSARECSEMMSHRSSLRTAFILAFVDGYFSPTSDDDRNLKDSTNSKDLTSQRRGLLSKLKSSTKAKTQHETVLEHCRELLRIIFAKSTTATVGMAKLSSSFGDSVYRDSRSIATQTTPDTITFAMRHRCLRTAAILLPQQALEQVLEEEEFQTSFRPSSFVSLGSCTFPAFVAKEVEEMGLPIPHSDLLHLSQMHFPSYARALWRYHRDKKDTKGRLLLLILEMYLTEAISDTQFFNNVLREIVSLGLPRTILLALECTVYYINRVESEKKHELFESSITFISNCFDHLSSSFCSDFNNPSTQSERSDASSTLLRIVRLFSAYLESVDVQKVLVGFVNSLIPLQPFALFEQEGDDSNDEWDEIYNAFIDTLERVDSKDVICEVQNLLADLFPKRTPALRVIQTEHGSVSQAVLSSSFRAAEDSIVSFFAMQESNSSFGGRSGRKSYHK